MFCPTKRASRLAIRTTLSGALVAIAAAQTANAQTAFTYQGQLKQSGNLVNANVNMIFKLFNALGGGAQQGPTLTFDGVGGNPAPVAVTNGLFTVSLDFGVSPYTANASRWLEITVSGQVLAPRQALTAAPLALNTRGIAVDSAGNVGIGTSSPGSLLDVRGPLTLDSGGDAAVLTGTGAAELNRYLSLFNSLQFTSASGLKAGGVLVSDSYAFANPGKSDLIVKGNVGIGTATLNFPLSIKTSSVFGTYGWVQTDGTRELGSYVSTSGGWLGTRSNHPLFFFTNDSSPHLTITATGNVGIGTTSPATKLHVVGTTRTNVVEVTGGDVAEKFPCSDRGAKPGTVMELDPDHPGQLRIARGAYSPRVAGVVSGAGDLPAGAILGNLPGSEDAPPIALSGRVWVQCDASEACIQTGDMLTTSASPGQAMKAIDRERSHGAIIGKAMTALGRGERGLVLVLVNLQ